MVSFACDSALLELGICNCKEAKELAGFVCKKLQKEKVGGSSRTRPVVLEINGRMMGKLGIHLTKLVSLYLNMQARGWLPEEEVWSAT